MGRAAIGGAWLQPGYKPEAIFTVEQFSAEEQALFEATEKFCAQRVWPQAAAIDAKQEGLLASLMDQASELGLTMIDIPQAYGGLELPVPVSMRVLEKSAREQSFMLSLMVQNGIGSLPVVLFGDEAQKAQWLPGFASGAKRGCYCLTEPGSGSDALAARTSARLGDDGHWRLNGTKQFITNAAIADVGFVFAQVVQAVDGAQGFTCFIVPLDAPGVSLGREEDKLGIKGSSTCQVILRDAQVPRGNVLGEIGQGHVIAFNILNNGRYKLGGTALGTAKYALNAALDYARNRKQFGVPVTDFGLIRRKIGQLSTEIFAVESAIYRLCGDIERDAQARGYDAPAKLAALRNHALECSIAKIGGSELLGRVCDEALQMFGGYGFLEDYPAAKYLRDARIARIYEGTNEINRILMPRALLKNLAASDIALDTNAGDEGPIDRMKRDTVACIQAVTQMFGTGKGFDRDQEVMANLADMMLGVYVTESARLRVAQMSAPTPAHHDLVALCTSQNGCRVRELAGEVMAHLGKTWDHSSPMAVDRLALRQAVAVQVLDRGQYDL